MQGYRHDPEDTEAETIVLRRVEEEGPATDADGDEAGGTAGDALYARLRALIVGQIVSTGDRFAGHEIIEIVPPDEPALVTEDTILEVA